MARLLTPSADSTKTMMLAIKAGVCDPWAETFTFSAHQP